MIKDIGTQFREGRGLAMRFGDSGALDEARGCGGPHRMLFARWNSRWRYASR